MTVELQWKVFSQVVCLRSKLYSIQFEDGVKQNAKRLQKSVKKAVMMTKGIYSMTAFIRLHTDATKLRDSQAAIINLFHIFW